MLVEYWYLRLLFSKIVKSVPVVHLAIFESFLNCKGQGQKRR